jgi:anthranilate synthase component 1
VSDEKMAADLLADEKEKAEHRMLVDLTRNDIGSISIPGSVNVVKLLNVENFSSVMHLSSTVQGILHDDFDAIDALKAGFPAGTLSGAPKIRAMEIIDNLENTRRGFYGGAVCAFDSLGNLESCIAIRTAVIKNSTAVVRAGAGIVFDSDPQKEADETFHKARSILEGVLMAEELRS